MVVRRCQFSVTCCFRVADGTLSLTGTDLEMEMVARVSLIQPHEAGATTVPARKFFDICRGLPEGAEIAVQLKATVCWCAPAAAASRCRPLPAADFPNLDDWQSEVEFTLPQATMKRLIEATQFFDGAPGCPLLLKRHAV